MIKQNDVHDAIPEWLIDDTAGIEGARIFVAHTVEPIFFGELLPEDEAGLEPFQFSGLPYCQVLTNIWWVHEPIFDANELCRSLTEAIENHEAIRNSED